MIDSYALASEDMMSKVRDSIGSTEPETLSLIKDIESISKELREEERINICIEIEQKLESNYLDDRSYLNDWKNLSIKLKQGVRK